MTTHRVQRRAQRPGRDRRGSLSSGLASTRSCSRRAVRHRRKRTRRWAAAAARRPGEATTASRVESRSRKTTSSPSAPQRGGGRRRRAGLEVGHVGARSDGSARRGMRAPRSASPADLAVRARLSRPWSTSWPTIARRWPGAARPPGDLGDGELRPSGVNASRMRTARDSEDSPVGNRGMPAECARWLSFIERVFPTSHRRGDPVLHDRDLPRPRTGGRRRRDAAGDGEGPCRPTAC